MRICCSLTVPVCWPAPPYLAWHAPPTASLPEQSFEQFWQAFRDNYAFFPLKKVDWDSTYRAYRPRVTAQTPPDSLVALLGRMVEPLHDGHITISRGETILFKGESARNSFKQSFRAVQPEFWQVAYQQLRAAGFSAVKGLGPKFKDKQRALRKPLAAPSATCTSPATSPTSRAPSAPKPRNSRTT